MNRRGSTRPFPHILAGWAAFSLIEILVVLGLIAFLSAAIVVVLPRVANASKIAATRATIKKVDELLNDRINGFNRWIQTQDNAVAGSVNAPNYVLSSPYVGPPYQGNLPLQKVLASKYWFQRSFPQSFSEITTSPRPTSKDPRTESAACLYRILTQGAIFDTEPPAAADLKGAEIADTDKDGNLEIVDAWGNPLRYYRWPTRLLRPATSSGTIGAAGWNNLAAGPGPTPASILIRSTPRAPIKQWTQNFTYLAGTFIQPANVPAGDVMMYQCTVSGGATSGTSGGTEPTWSTATGQGQATAMDGNITWIAAIDPLAVDSDDPSGLASLNQVSESTFHTWGTYHVTLIVSCGSDEALGLFEPNDTSTFGILAQPQGDQTRGVWQANNVYSPGDTAVAASGNLIAFRCVTGGTSGGSAPTWPTQTGVTVTDGSVTWLSIFNMADALLDDITNHQQ